MSTFDTIFIRSLSPAMAKILLVFLIEKSGMTVDELASKTGFNDRHTLYRACRDLADSAYGMLVKQTGAHGKDIWMPAGALLPMMRGEYFANPDGGSSTIWIEEQPMKQIQMVEKPPSGTENNAKMAPDGGTSTIWKQKNGFNHDDESIDLINIESSIINPIEKFPTCEKLLEPLDLLFGDSLDISEIPKDTMPKLLLSWTVKAYHDRKRISSPLGLIRARLKTKTPRSLPKDWQDILPGSYLEAIGMRPVLTAPIVDTDDQDEEPDEPEPEPAIVLDVGHPEIVDAWVRAVQVVGQEMPKAAFDSYLRGCYLAGWDDEHGTLTVNPRNPGAVEWLTGRLTSTMERALWGILGRGDIHVIFSEYGGT